MTGDLDCMWVKLSPTYSLRIEPVRFGKTGEPALSFSLCFIADAEPQVRGGFTVTLRSLPDLAYSIEAAHKLFNDGTWPIGEER
jgi:hypothetical protein